MWLLLLCLLAAYLAEALPHRFLDTRRVNTAQQTSWQNSTEHEPILNRRSESSPTSSPSTWWFPNIDHSSPTSGDFVPNLSSANGSTDLHYPVYQAVASGDIDGFINALYGNGPSGVRDNFWLAGQPRVVYLASGTYVLDSTVYLDTDTVLVGDAINPPVIQASQGFTGDYLLCGGQGGDTDSGGESHFSITIKNVILDTTPAADTPDLIALSWRVAQNTALINVQINMPKDTHTGVWLGQGSPVSVSDVAFSGGSIGLHYAGMQQATLKNLHFTGCTTGILIDAGFSISILAPNFNAVANPIVLQSGSPWVSVVDGTSKSSGTFFASSEQYPNFMVENISQDNTNTPLVVVNGVNKIAGVDSVGTYVYGNTYSANPVYQTNSTIQNLNRPSALVTSDGRYPILTAPQYTDATPADVINLKNYSQNGGVTLHGDGASDDTEALQSALSYAASHSKIAFLPFGVYIVTSTVTIPSGTRLIGNAWSTISGSGSTFADASNPTPIIRIGQSGEVGTAVVQEMRFTIAEKLPGAIILQINLAGHQPGDVAVFNSLITVGGTRDTRIDCDSESNCIAASIGLHLSPTSSAYVENFWSWTADHAADNSGKGTRIAAKGGVLIEATQGTWLTGLASEHWWLYQLSWHGARNVFNSLFQSETNYNQGANAVVQNAVVQPPAPFTDADAADPSFTWCEGSGACTMGVAQFFPDISANENIFQYGAANWNFFGGQQAFMTVMLGDNSDAGSDSSASTASTSSNPQHVHLYGLCDHGATNLMRLPNGTSLGDGAEDGFGGSWGSLMAEMSL